MPSSPFAGARLLVLLLTAAIGEAFNITKILGEYQEFSTFNHYLSATHLSGEINRRRTITVCAVDNAAMNDLLSSHPSINKIKNVLSYHVLLDFFDGKKLHQINNGTLLTTALFQTTGNAPGSSGFVNITDLDRGAVSFRAENGPHDARFVRSVTSQAFDISVIQISRILSSPEAEAPSPVPAQLNFTSIMSSKGCGQFAKVLSGSDAEKAFVDNLESGLTLFCPIDAAFTSFLPRFNNLTVSNKTKLLLYHGIPVYQSLSMLKSNNGDQSTLATERNKKFDIKVQNDGEEVTLETKIVTTKISGTLFDEQPDAIFSIGAVLLPKELFKAEAPAPSPALSPEAEPPKAGKGKHAPAPKEESDSPAPAPSDDPADQTADDSGSGCLRGGLQLVGAGLSSLLVGFLMM